ncbi:MAG: radical SAM protein, partial [Actinobacteria bacterium]|nr:radical SAM protein [Actinomycetota bacterium]
MDHLRLKAELLVEGINPTADALQGVGTEYKEQNHGLFGWDFVDHPDLSLPDDFVLADGTVVQFRYNPSSPYIMERRGDRRVIARAGEVLDTAALIPRPRYYDAASTSGALMRQIAQIGGEDCFFVCYQNYCLHFARREECA